MNYVTAICVLASSLLLAACQKETTTDAEMARNVEKAQAEPVAVGPAPTMAAAELHEVATRRVTASDIRNQSDTPVTFVSYDVVFNPNANSSDLGIVSSGQNCPEPAKNPGCVRFKANTFGTITFWLKGQRGPGAQSCGKNGVDWVITKVEGSETSKSTDSQESGNWGSDLPGWVTDAFYPIADASAGLLYEGTVAESKTAVTLLNLNNNPWVEGVVKTLYYRVTATKCDETATKISDPGVENEGLR